jgi:tetratricopeptide (TPR) repeat protein
MTRTNSPSLRVALSVALFLAFIGASGSVRAAGPLAPDDGCLRDTACFDHYNKAVGLYEKGRYEAALPEFQAAYQLRQMPWLLINIGRTLHRLGRLEEAITYYQNYQRAAPNGDPETARKVQEYITQARVLLEVKTTTSSGPGGSPPPPPILTPTPEPTAQTSIEPSKSPTSPATPEKPFYKKWWFWTIVGGGAGIILITGIAVGASRSGPPPDPIPMDATVYQPMF